MVNGKEEYAYNSDTNTTVHIITIICHKQIAFSSDGIEV